MLARNRGVILLPYEEKEGDGTMDHDRMPDTDSAFAIRIDDIMIDCPDAHKLGNFYAGLLGWSKTVLNKECVSVSAANQPIRLLCQQEEGYVPPVWPEAEGRQ